MAETRRVGDLEIGQDLEFQRREWRLQRAGWVVMALIVLVALLGLFGGGPIGRAQAGAGPLTVDYSRFDRRRSPSELRLAIAGDATGSGEVSVWLATDYLDALDVQTILPEPDTFQAGAERTVLVFEAAEAGQPIAVSIEYEPEPVGLLDGRIGLVGGDAVAIRHLVYP